MRRKLVYNTRMVKKFEDKRKRHLTVHMTVVRFLKTLDFYVLNDQMI